LTSARLGHEAVTAWHRADLAQGDGDCSRGQLDEVAPEQALLAAPDAKHVGQRCPGHRADGGVQARHVPARGDHCDALHRGQV